MSVTAMMALLRPRAGRLALAAALGVLSLGSALALAGVAAWLITRAWQMPPVLDLSVAVVAVRALGISRGVFGYCERLAAHDTALRAAGNTRRDVYDRLAHGPVEDAVRPPGGELVARIGSDVDELSDVVVRAVLPIIVAAVLSVLAVATVAVISPAVAAVLAASLLLAGALAPWLAGRSVTAAETVAAQAHSDRDVAVMLALEHAPELRVSGRLSGLIAESAGRQRDWGRALDRAAAPAAVAAAVPTAAIGVSVLGAAVAAIAMAPTVAPTTLAVLMLLPLSSFEATAALPGAAVALTRARMAGDRLAALTHPAPHRPTRRLPTDAPTRLIATGVRSGYHDAATTGPHDLRIEPGTRLAITGPSGAGKTALLMTLAGLLPVRAGRITLGPLPLDDVDEADIRSRVAFFAEDAHVFATTVRDNLLVVRGDADDAELDAVLHRVGLSDWLAGLPDGLATVLTGGAAAVSAGQRRRLLLARAMLSTSPIVLLDEPTEHLDADDSAGVLTELLTVGGLFPAERAVVVATHQLPADDPGRLAGCPALTLAPAGYARQS